MNREWFAAINVLAWALALGSNAYMSAVYDHKAGWALTWMLLACAYLVMAGMSFQKAIA